MSKFYIAIHFSIVIVGVHEIESDCLNEHRTKN